MRSPTIDLDAVNEELERAHPRETLQWAFDAVSPFAVNVSFQVGGLVLAHMARDIVERVPVLFIETGYHFAETLEFKDKVVREWNLEVIEAKAAPGQPKDLWKQSTDACCEVNKVQPFQRALEGLSGYANGARREQSLTRRHVPIVERQILPSGKTILKVNPLASWTKQQLWHFVREHDVPVHPLYDEGYASIGCAPCTRPIVAGEDERAGRWSGSDKTECGILTFGTTDTDPA